MNHRFYFVQSKPWYPLSVWCCSQQFYQLQTNYISLWSNKKPIYQRVTSKKYSQNRNDKVDLCLSRQHHLSLTAGHVANRLPCPHRGDQCHAGLLKVVGVIHNIEWQSTHGSRFVVFLMFRISFISSYLRHCNWDNHTIAQDQWSNP